MDMVEHNTEHFHLYVIFPDNYAEQRVEKEIIFCSVEKHSAIKSLYIQMMESSFAVKSVLAIIHGHFVLRP